MNKLELSDGLFWKWMEGDSSDLGIGGYLKIMSNSFINEFYDIDALDIESFQNESSSMENLSLCIPRDYFLEIQYCAKTYATMFGKVFPQFACHIDQLAYIEWLLYTEPGYLPYRDHMVHMFKVAFICDQLLSGCHLLLDEIEKWQFNSQHFNEWCNVQGIDPSSWSNQERQEVVKLSLFLAALFHDVGYGYYFLTKYKGRLFKLYEWLLPHADPTDMDAAGTKVLLSSLPAKFVQTFHAARDKQGDGKSVPPQAIAGFFHDCLPLNHSVSSMFFVLDLAAKLRHSRALPDKLYVAFQLAAEACMIHDMTGENSWLHLKKNDNGHFIDQANCMYIPLAVLLIFADELAVWNRPQFDIRPRKNSTSYVFKIGSKKGHIVLHVDGIKRDILIDVSTLNDRIRHEIGDKFMHKLPCFRGTSTGKDCPDPKLFDYRIEIVEEKRS